MTPDELISNPEWFAFAIDAPRDSVGFIRSNREELSGAGMLLQRFHRMRDREHAAAPFAAVPDSLNVAPAALIFHSAFCGSTLLARCLDRPGVGLALKEPLCVAQLAQQRPTRADKVWSMADWRDRVGKTADLLSRPFAPGERVLVKLTYNANHMIADYAAQRPHRALLMFGGLRAFLVSVLSRSEKRHPFVRGVFAEMRDASPELGAWSEETIAALSPLQLAALSWSLQMELFQAALDALPADRAASLHFDDFLDAPEARLADTARFLEVAFSDAEIEDQVAREVFTRHSKHDDKAYSRERREAGIAKIEDEHGAAITAAVDWLKDARPDFASVDRLPRGVNAAPVAGGR